MFENCEFHVVVPVWSGLIQGTVAPVRNCRNCELRPFAVADRLGIVAKLAQVHNPLQTQARGFAHERTLVQSPYLRQGSRCASHTSACLQKRWSGHNHHLGRGRHAQVGENHAV